MKTWCMLFLAFCGVMLFLIAPGTVSANVTFTLPSDPNGVGAYRDFGDLSFYKATLAIVYLTNGVEKAEAAQVTYSPDPGGPGYIYGDPDKTPYPLTQSDQYTFVINLPRPTGGQLPNVPGLDGGNQGVYGLLALYDTQTPPTLPTDFAGWTNPAFLSQVSAIVAFTPETTVVVFENCHQVPEPGVLLFLGPGLMALAGVRRVIKK